ncbi:substrate-binding domain-containing protein [Undibacterium arcticum]|uniref:substrate-binding domain-containing protein n=1 Tax=Undibacterium arcticum TaxID=1762892 RepID=UPI003618D24E
MKITTSRLAAMLAVLGLSIPAFAEDDATLFMSRANARIAKAMRFQNRWDGPTTGVKISQKRNVILIGSDLHDPSQSSIASGVKEAAQTAGWNLMTIDCWGSTSRHAEAFSRALALNPDGIVVAGIDTAAIGKELAAAAKKKIPVVGWHASPKPGPAAGLFANVNTDPKEAAQIAALLGVVESKGKSGIVIFTDSSNVYAMAKSNEIVSIIKQCQTCSLLAVEDLPLADAPKKMPDVLAALVKRFGKKWTQTIASSDQYLDLMATPAASATLAGNSPQAISAGDGSELSYRRIRDKNLQIGTVPEPFQMQGWQLLDELNRAIAGEKPSGYENQSYLVTASNISYHGGAKNNFDPDNGYRAEYKKIWMK